MNENTEKLRILRQERTELNNQALKETSERLSKIFDVHNVQLIAFAAEIGKNRTTLHNYLKGNTEINEAMVILIGEKFDLEPIEVRYKTRKYRESDLEWLIRVVEEYILKKSVKLPAEVRSVILSRCYTFYIQKLIDFEQVHSADIIDKAKELLDMFQVGLQHANEA